MKEIKEGLTFKDVLLIPKRSRLVSRSQVDISTKLYENFVLKLPIISAAMDTVTESEMAIALARLGGLGIIHRFCSIEDQIQEVKKVKMVENYFIENPICISPETTLKEVKEKIKKFNFHTFLVVDDKKRLLGLISKRDYFLENDDNKKVKYLMTPFDKLIVSYNKITFNQAKDIFKKHKIEKIPIIDRNRKVLGLITLKDFTFSLNKKAVRDKKGRLAVGAAIGIRGDYLERAEELVKAGVDILCIDVAHGHLEKCLKVVKEIKRKFPDIPLIAGNVATREGAFDLRQAGADIIKVGIGSGSVCTTRVVTGVGVPQLTAIMLAREGAGKLPIIADGGCRDAGDIVKALAAGANAVMLGSLLAGTDEAPGKIIRIGYKKFKLFRGMSSSEAFNRKQKYLNYKVKFEPTSEGLDYGFIEYKGAVEEVILDLEKAIRSGFSYCGALNLKELWKNAEFIKVSSQGIKENYTSEDIKNIIN